MDLHMSNLSTLVEGPWCVTYATRCQVYWGLTHVIFFWYSALIPHTQDNTDRNDVNKQNKHTLTTQRKVTLERLVSLKIRDTPPFSKQSLQLWLVWWVFLSMFFGYCSKETVEFIKNFLLSFILLSFIIYIFYLFFIWMISFITFHTLSKIFCFLESSL